MRFQRGDAATVRQTHSANNGRRARIIQAFVTRYGGSFAEIEFSDGVRSWYHTDYLSSDDEMMHLTGGRYPV